jgi:predicted acyl esterase
MGGFQQLVRGEPFRGKFRNGFDKPQPFAPGEVAKVAYTMPDVFHTFRAGHRVMVQVQSSWFPLVDRNPQTFVDIYQAKRSDFRKATHRIHRGPGATSMLRVAVLGR